MRLYTFINFYLSQIQQGIQTAHIVHELFNKYKFAPTPAALDLSEWSHNHKTIIVLNGGSDIDIEFISAELAKSAHVFPWAEFREDAGLGYVRTGVGVVLPETIYDAKWIAEEGVFRWLSVDAVEEAVYHADHPLFNFLKLLKSKRLA